MGGRNKEGGKVGLSVNWGLWGKELGVRKKKGTEYIEQMLICWFEDSNIK